MSAADSQRAEYEYVVVGSGAGGGTVAARLAEAGRKVLLLEAGGDSVTLQGSDPAGPDRLPDDYHVPVFHAFSTENTAMKWDFYVRHYESQALQKRDPKYREAADEKDVNGVLYPRAGTLGGCTAHNAMILVYPHNADWDDIAHLTGDNSWKANNMRRYFERMENCEHRPLLRFLAKFGFNPSRRGFNGWITTQMAAPIVAAADPAIRKTLFRSAVTASNAVGHKFKRLFWFLKGRLDPNDWRLVKDNAVGLRYPPLATKNHARTGTREFLIETARRYPNNLTIELDALATRVLFDGDQRAIGVEYLKGARLYRAHFDPSTAPGETRQVYVSREVILSGGAFNTPQLLMLSGVGPRAELEKHGITVRVDLPGIGTNLQDRYEVGVVNRMKFDHWKVLEGAEFAKGDPQYEMWKRRKGVYCTNGAVLAVIKKSDPGHRLPDLFCFALLANFPGYFPGYSRLFLPPDGLRYLTWAILKAHTNNTAGTVTLRSADPRDPPEINFHYFEEGNDTSGADLEAVVDGVQFVRKMTAEMSDIIDEEELPGAAVQTDDEIREFVKSHAWGHHASCTCPIGPREESGVLTSDFRVHGTSGLRVVDASVFPKIPGFFIVSAVYMVGEKASDVILEAASHSQA
ncbi:MAG: GMC family oxidoreductase N-terminal domain-containing protein [Bryobacterales bacterium]|nr:GMC family oxidoreductase N-terminal domain-containing protein [Bryobacterales bacterium]